MTPAEIFATAFGAFGAVGTVLACTWHLSAKLTTLVVGLQQHTKEDEQRFRHLEGRINELFRWISAITRHTFSFPPPTLPEKPSDAP